ncbi:hypothetical protein CNY89_07980, partial [Amaricoccus sp. HAR-UPW-R2A-40]
AELLDAAAPLRREAVQPHAAPPGQHMLRMAVALAHGRPDTIRMTGHWRLPDRPVIGAGAFLFLGQDGPRPQGSIPGEPSGFAGSISDPAAPVPSFDHGETRRVAPEVGEVMAVGGTRAETLPVRGRVA